MSRTSAQGLGTETRPTAAVQALHREIHPASPLLLDRHRPREPDCRVSDESRFFKQISRTTSRSHRRRLRSAERSGSSRNTRRHPRVRLSTADAWFRPAPRAYHEATTAFRERTTDVSLAARLGTGAELDLNRSILTRRPLVAPEPRARVRPQSPPPFNPSRTRRRSRAGSRSSRPRGPERRWRRSRKS